MYLCYVLICAQYVTTWLGPKNCGVLCVKVIQKVVFEISRSIKVKEEKG